MRGRYKEPAALTLVKGAPSHRPIPIAAETGCDIGDPPAGTTKAVRKVWERLRHEWRLLLTDQDRAAFLAYCRAVVRHDRLERALNREGEFDFNGQGRMVVSAAFRAFKESERDLMKYYVLFGATPATRGRVPGKTMSPGEARRGGLEALTGGKA